MAKLEQRGFATSFISTKPDEAIEKWMTQLLPSRELTYPTLGKGKSSSKCHFGGYVSSLEGIIHCHFLYFTLLILGNVKGISVKRVSRMNCEPHQPRQNSRPHKLPGGNVPRPLS